MAITNFNIISAATVKLRCTSVQSYSDGTRESAVAAGLYPQIVNRDLAVHPWQFNTLTVQLAQLVGTPLDPNWQYQYALPYDMLAFHGCMSTEGVEVPYLIENNVLFVQYPTALGKYQQVQTEEQFPAYFVDLLISHLAWEFAFPLTGDATLEEKFKEEYQIKYRFAINTDAKFNYPRPLIGPENSRYVNARLGSTADAYLGPIVVGN